MVKAQLLEVLQENRITYFRLKEIGVGTEGTYTEAEVYKALLNNLIQIDNLSIGTRYNKVNINPSFLAMQIHLSSISLEDTEDEDEIKNANTKNQIKPISKKERKSLKL